MRSKLVIMLCEEAFTIWIQFLMSTKNFFDGGCYTRVRLFRFCLINDLSYSLAAFKCRKRWRLCSTITIRFSFLSKYTAMPFFILPKGLSIAIAAEYCLGPTDAFRCLAHEIAFNLFMYIFMSCKNSNAVNKTLSNTNNVEHIFLSFWNSPILTISIFLKCPYSYNFHLFEMSLFLQFPSFWNVPILTISIFLKCPYSYNFCLFKTFLFLRFPYFWNILFLHFSSFWKVLILRSTQNQFLNRSNVDLVGSTKRT